MKINSLVLKTPLGEFALQPEDRGATQEDIDDLIKAFHAILAGEAKNWSFKSPNGSIVMVPENVLRNSVFVMTTK